MGEHDVSEVSDSKHLRSFTQALLQDMRALERMLEEGRIETDKSRIGAEQELFLVDERFQPARTAQAILERLGDGPFTTELGVFNIEANLPPLAYGADCLSKMEANLHALIGRVREAAQAEDSRVVMCGILPTLDKSHLSLDWMTPNPRYLELNRVMVDWRGGEFRTLIKGLDELQTTHDNVMLEACNTSFQVHFQVAPSDFARLYNLAQAVTGPVLAAAVNSPVLLQHRLWHETRVALFQQSLDLRSETVVQRGGHQRVRFGDEWVKESVLEIFRDDVARFRALLASDPEESPMDVLDRGEVPGLKALCMHNSTIYRWNRPCYGVSNGHAHLRIENRVLPSGPTVLDEIANAAFFFGLLSSLGDEFEDITKVMDFDDARQNFMAAGRYGLDASFRWMQDKPVRADELILHDLLPRAREGLEHRQVNPEDIARYLGVIEERAKAHRTGSQWVLDSLDSMGASVPQAERFRALTAAMYENQAAGDPVHTWPLAGSCEVAASAPENFRTIAQIMTTDLFTVHPEDVIDLAASLMDWEHIRHVPVEDQQGRLVGLVSHRALLRMLAQGNTEKSDTAAVREIMTSDPITVTPELSCLEAMNLMRDKKVGCLPVVSEGNLVGIVTEKDFIDLASTLLNRWLKEE